MDGYSMGGFAALHDAFLHPSLFSKVGVAARIIRQHACELNVNEIQHIMHNQMNTTNGLRNVSQAVSLT